MKYRHELKYIIGRSDYIAASEHLSLIAKPDSHAENGRYKIRSLYFDNDKNKALREKIDGVNYREKFRIRCYNGDYSYICLEKKSKINGLCNKQSTRLTFEQCKAIIDGDFEWMKKSDDKLIFELYSKTVSLRLKPAVIVDYTREPWVYDIGNVRITFDYNIRTGLKSTDFFNPECITVPAGNEMIMEVKWDEVLPDIIKSAVRVTDTHTSAFSKYAMSRIYG